MTTIRIPAMAVVLILGGKRAPLAETAALFDAAASSPWDVNEPDAALESLHAALSASPQVRVCMLRSHAKARKTVATAARKHGARTICIRLPGAEDVDAAAERIDAVHDLTGPDNVIVETIPMPVDRRADHGPFDIIGDPHGCAHELLLLLVLLGHAVLTDDGFELVRHPEGRKVVLLGDLTDRGPNSLLTMEVARELQERFGALITRGNHDDKLRRWLLGRKVEVRAGLATTIAELEHMPEAWKRDMAAWIETFESHYMLDGGRLVVAHAGLAEEHHGRSTNGSMAFAMYGDVTGEIDENEVPIASDWALDYAGEATVVHGHVVHKEPREINNVVAIDTGCAFGNRLTAYRWPERTFESVPAQEAYFESHTRALEV